MPKHAETKTAEFYPLFFENKKYKIKNFERHYGVHLKSLRRLSIFIVLFCCLNGAGGNEIFLSSRKAVFVWNKKIYLSQANMSKFIDCFLTVC